MLSHTDTKLWTELLHKHYIPCRKDNMTFYVI